MENGYRIKYVARLEGKNVPKEKRGIFAVTFKDAVRLNKQGYGIFFPANIMCNGLKATNVTRVRCWVAEYDDGTKEEQLERIKGGAFLPSLIVESKRGYQCYWLTSDGTKEWWKPICKAIARSTGGDDQMSIQQALRAPGFYHWKDKENPFLVKTVYTSKIKYSESILREVYELAKLEEIPYNISMTGYSIVECPRCHHREAFVYDNNPNKVVCNRRKQCGFIGGVA